MQKIIALVGLMAAGPAFASEGNQGQAEMFDEIAKQIVGYTPFLEGARLDPYESALCNFLSVPFQREAAVEVPFELFRLYGDDIVEIELNVSYIYPSDIDGDSVGVAEQEPVSLSSEKAARTMPEVFVAAQVAACKFVYVETTLGVGIE